MLQILFALLAGALTVGAPCILPLLPILLGASVGQKSRTRPLFIALGFVITFAAVGLALSYLTRIFNLSPDTLRTIAIIALGIFGGFMIWPLPFELLTQRLSGLITKASQASGQAGAGNFGGFVLGVMLGIIWTPCAGPVLGSILTLIATSTDVAKAGILLTAYAIGAGLPMLAIAYGGQFITTKISGIAKYSRILQQIFGLLILLLAIAMYKQYDLVIQAKLLDLFPSWNFANLKIFK